MQTELNNLDMLNKSPKTIYEMVDNILYIPPPKQSEKIDLRNKFR